MNLTPCATLSAILSAKSDNAFIELVDNLEKIRRDLTTLDQLVEIANVSILSKLEANLPSQISKIWISSHNYFRNFY